MTPAEITLPTTLGGERVVCLFPIIGGDSNTNFIEADLVTVASERNGNADTWRVLRYRPKNNGGEVVSSGDPLRSFSEAIRIARRNAGWG